MFDRRKDNQGVLTPTCIQNYHPTIFQQILEEGVSQLQYINNEVNNESDSVDISELTNLLDNENKKTSPIQAVGGSMLSVTTNSLKKYTLAPGDTYRQLHHSQNKSVGPVTTNPYHKL